MLEILKKKLVERGPKGILELQKFFKNNSPDSIFISKGIFCYSLKQMKLQFDEEEFEIMYKEFDKESTNNFNYKDFLNQIKGSLSEIRITLINSVFNILPKNNEGNVELSEFKAKYIAEKHPAVLESRKTPNQALNEMIELIEIYKQLSNKEGETFVTFAEFRDIYTCVSFTIDNNKTFENLLVSTWNIPPIIDLMSSSTIKEKIDLEANKTPSEKIKDDISEKTFSSHLNSNIEEAPPINQNSPKSPSKVESIQSPFNASQNTQKANKGEELCQKLKAEVIKRGIKSILGMERHLKLLDKDKTGIISCENLKNALDDFKFPFLPPEVELIYNCIEGSKIKREKLMKNILGDLNSYRMKLIDLIFKSDKYQLDDLTNKFIARNHPDALSNKKRSQDILSEFIENINKVIEFLREAKGDGTVKKEEIVKYYSYLSAEYMNDKDFELMMRNVWEFKEEIIDNIPVVSQQITEPIISESKVVEIEKIPNMIHKSTKMGFNEVLNFLKNGLIAQGSKNIILFKENIIKDSLNETINFLNFIENLNKADFKLTQNNIEKIRILFDKGQKGVVNVKDIYEVVTPNLTIKRKKVIEDLFKQLDKEGKGMISLEEISNKYNAKADSRVESGEMNEFELLADFLDNLEACTHLRANKSEDKEIQLQDFFEYYSTLSCEIKNDEEFETKIHMFWK